MIARARRAVLAAHPELAHDDELEDCVQECCAQVLRRGRLEVVFGPKAWRWAALDAVRLVKGDVRRPMTWARREHNPQPPPTPPLCEASVIAASRLARLWPALGDTERVVIGAFLDGRSAAAAAREVGLSRSRALRIRAHVLGLLDGGPAFISYLRGHA